MLRCRVELARTSGAHLPSGWWPRLYAPGFKEEQHAMRNLFVFAVLGLAGLGWFAAQGSLRLLAMAANLSARSVRRTRREERKVRPARMPGGPCCFAVG